MLSRWGHHTFFQTVWPSQWVTSNHQIAVASTAPALKATLPLSRPFHFTFLLSPLASPPLSPLILQVFSTAFFHAPQMCRPSADAFVLRGVYGLMCIDRYFRLKNTNSYMRCSVKSLVWSHIWRPVGLLESWQLSAVSMICLGQRNIGRCDQHACVRLTVSSSLTI